MGIGAVAETSAEEPKLADIEARPLREMLVIAAPTVVTMTSYTVMQFIDGLMVSKIDPPSPDYMAAQGNGGIIAWLLIALGLGITGVLNTYVSQNLGAGKPREGAAYAWNALWICVITWVVLMLPGALFAGELFGLMSSASEALGAGGAAGEDSASLQEMQTEYARILLAGGLLVLAGRTIGHYFYGMHRPMIVMIAALTGNVVNVVANLGLIFGNFGMPAMGVGGAALGTVIGAGVEFAIPLAVFLSPKYARELGTLAGWRPSARHLRDLFKIGWPGGLMFFNELVCWSYLMTVLLGAAGRAAGESAVIHNTAGWIGLRYMHLSFMPTVGISIAVTAIVGKCMGMGRPDIAASRSWLAMRLALLYMGACAVGFVLFRVWMVDLFVPDDMGAEERAQLIAAGSTVMIAAAVFQVFDAVAIIMSGALRGAGDTVWPGIATIVLSWTCIVGGGHLLIWLTPELGSLGPWIGASAYIIALGIALLVRFMKGKWRSIQLLDSDASAA